MQGGGCEMFVALQGGTSALDEQCGDDGEEERDGHDDHADAEELPTADVEPFATDCNEQEDGGERAGDGEFGTEVDCNEKDPGEKRLKMNGAQRTAGDEAKGEIVEEIGADGHGGADRERG